MASDLTNAITAALAGAVAITVQWNLEHLGRKVIKETVYVDKVIPEKGHWEHYTFKAGSEQQSGRRWIVDEPAQTISVPKTVYRIDWTQLTTAEAVDHVNTPLAPPILSLAAYLASMGSDAAKDAADVAKEWMNVARPSTIVEGTTAASARFVKLLKELSPVF